MHHRLRGLALENLASGNIMRGGRKALDIGCGNGNDSIALADMGYEVEAIDRDPAKVQDLKSRIEGYSISVLLSDIVNFKIKKDTYSVILASNVLPFISYKAMVIQLLRGMTDGLQKGGILYFSLLGQRDTWSKKPGMTYFEYDEAISFLSQLPLKLYHRSTEEGYTITKEGEAKYSHVHTFTYIKQ